MKLRYIPSLITLSAGAVTSLICIFKGYDVLYSLEVLLMTLVIFAVIGFIAQAIIKSQVTENKRQEAEHILEEKRKELEEEYAKMEAENGTNEAEVEEYAETGSDVAE